jgi:hypothetical protein
LKKKIEEEFKRENMKKGFDKGKMSEKEWNNRILNFREDKELIKRDKLKKERQTKDRE